MGEISYGSKKHAIMDINKIYNLLHFAKTAVN